jgi:hypothetical protein
MCSVILVTVKKFAIRQEAWLPLLQQGVCRYDCERRIGCLSWQTLPTKAILNLSRLSANNLETNERT